MVVRAIHCMIFVIKQNTAYELRISDWSSGVCSSDLFDPQRHAGARERGVEVGEHVVARARIRRGFVRRPVGLAKDQRDAVGQGVGVGVRGVVDAVDEYQPRRRDVRDQGGVESGDGRLRWEERGVGNEWVSTCEDLWAP